MLSKLLAAVVAPEPGTNTIFGTVSPPPGVDKFNAQASSVGATTNIGLILFISNLIKVGTIIAGVWVLFNFISAGFIYITNSGESSSHNKVKDQITMSVLGLIIIVGAYTATAVISYFLFGSPDFILNPTIKGPTP
jgi:hypothetical protein